jgi:hypothetical protein
MFRHLVESLVIPDHENQICEVAVAAHARTEFEQRPEAFEPAIRHFRNHLSRAAFDDACGDIEVKIGNPHSAYLAAIRSAPNRTENRV